MKNLYFDDFEDLACAIADSYDSLYGEDFEDVAVVAKYEEARQIIKELLCLGYDIHSINIIDEEYGEYDAEYIISIYDDEIWCEQMLRENGYITDYSPVMYILDNCSSKVIPYCNGKIIYEVTVGEIDYDECDCKCDCCGSRSDENKPDGKDNFVIKVKCDLDAEEANKIIKDMEKRIERMNDMFREMDIFRWMFRW